MPPRTFFKQNEEVDREKTELGKREEVSALCYESSISFAFQRKKKRAGSQFFHKDIRR